MTCKDELAMLKQQLAVTKAEAARYRTLFEAMMDGYARTDMAGHVLESNAVFQQMLGYTPEELASLTYTDFTPPRWRDYEATVVTAQLQARGYSNVYEKEYQRKDGTLVPVEMRIYLLRDAAGQPSGMWALVRDITDRKEVTAALAARERFLADLLDTVPLAIFWKDRDSVYRGCNAVFADVVGLPTPAAIVGKTDNDLPWPPEEAAAYRADDAEVIVSGEVKRHIVEPLLQADGTRQWVDTTKVPLRDAQGVVTGVLGVYLDITERKRAEEALVESRAMLQLVLDSIPVRVFWKDRDLRFLGCNTPFAQDSGLATAGELIGKTDFDMGWRDQAVLYQADDCAVIASGEAKLNYEEPQSRPDGSTRWLRTSKIPLRNVEGLIIGVLGVYEDITERKQAEQALKDSERRLRALIDYAPFGAMEYTLEPDGRLVFSGYNEACSRILGTDCAVFMGKTLEENFPPLVDTSIPHAYRQAARTGERYEEEQVHYEQGEISGVFEVIAFQTAPMRMAVLFRDITERKKAELELARERAFLLTSIDILPLPIFYLTPLHEVILPNSAAERLMALDHHDWQTFDVRTATGSVLPLAEHPGLRALHGEVTRNMEAVLHFPDGRDMPVLLNAAPIRIDHELAAAVIAIQDITKLKEADRMKDQFLMTLSHELKTPLTSIKGWAQAAEKMADIVPEALSIILRNADEQMAVLEDLLVVSRMVTGRFTIAPEPFDLRDIVHAAVENIMQEAAAHQLQVIEEAPPDPLPILADPRRFTQAINNLLYNAVKFTNPNGSIWVRTFRESDRAVVQVQDTGRGIAHEELSHLFRPFIQFRREENNGGLGLGLSLVYGIVEAHGGTVQGESPGLGQGSTFTIRLPLAEAAVD